MENKRKKEEAKLMKRAWKVYSHPLYQECLKKIRKEEKKRKYCIHDVEHYLSVARLAYIFALERGYAISKEQIYVTALLHDIGKWRQYKDGVPHEEASAVLAKEILTDLGFSKPEIQRIRNAILNHRKLGPEGEKDLLSEVIFDADKLSRRCFECEMSGKCDWSDEKKNLRIYW